MTKDEQTKKINYENTKLKNDIREILRTEPGKRFMWYILHDICKVNHDISGDEAHVRRRLGQRSVALALMSDIEFSGSELYLNMALFNANELSKEEKDNE